MTTLQDKYLGNRLGGYNDLSQVIQLGNARIVQPTRLWMMGKLSLGELNVKQKYPSLKLGRLQITSQGRWYNLPVILKVVPMS